MNEQIEELLPFYVLGALTDEETAVVEAYLAANPEARQRLDALAEPVPSCRMMRRRLPSVLTPRPSSWRGCGHRRWR